MLTPEKLCLRNEVIFLSSASRSILWRVPRCIPCGCGLISVTTLGSLSVVLGQFPASMIPPSLSRTVSVIVACGFTIEVILRY